MIGILRFRDKEKALSHRLTPHITIASRTGSQLKNKDAVPIFHMADRNLVA